MKKDILNDDTGRSMVEMLGTLAIIGVLSVGGVAGYNSAMNRMKANEVIDEANKRALVVAMSIAAGGGQEKESVSLAEFKNNEVAGATFGTVATMQDGLYQITITNLPRKVYALVKASLGAKSGIKISEPCEPAGDSCSAFFYFDENLRSDPQATNGGSSAADSASQAPNYYCDPIDNGQACREDKPADCERCNGTCEVGVYGKLADICQPFKYTCNDAGLTKGVGSGGASSGYPCACAEDSGYFYNDEQARAALCNSTALQSYYCSSQGGQDVCLNGNCSACPSGNCYGNGGFYSNFGEAMLAMCSVGAGTPETANKYFECKDGGTKICQVDTESHGPGETVPPDTCRACPTGYGCVNGAGYSGYRDLIDVVNDMCSVGAGTPETANNFFVCKENGTKICQVDTGHGSGERLRVDTCSACPTGYKCVSGSGYYGYRDLNGVVNAKCSVDTGYFECKESGTKICQVDVGSHGPGETVSPDTCEACPTGYGCVNGAGYNGYYLGEVVNAKCTGGAADGGYYCYNDGKTVGNNYGIKNTCNTGFVCTPGERSQYYNEYSARDELCTIIGRLSASPGTVSPTESVEARYYCDSLGRNVVTPNGSPEACPDGYWCPPNDTGNYVDYAAAKANLCTKDLRKHYYCGVVGYGIINSSNNSQEGSCFINFKCSPGSKGKYLNVEAARDGLCYQEGAPGTESVAAGGTTRALFKCSRGLVQNFNLNEWYSCPSGYGCNAGDSAYYDNKDSATDTSNGLCTKDLRKHYYCGVDGYGIINSSSNSQEASCFTNSKCSPGSKGKYLDGQVAIDGLCYQEGASGTESVPAGGSFVANTTAYDCRNNNTVCLSGYEECNTCSRGKGCLKGASGMYSDLDEAVEGICTGSVNQAKADQTPITNDLPWWV